MKILIIAFLLALSFNSSGQSQVAGLYYNHFFSELKMNVDSTFEYNHYSHFIGRWTKGTWTLDGDTVYFHIVPMYDTLSITKVDSVKADTHILSKFSIPGRMTAKDTAMVIMT